MKKLSLFLLIAITGMTAFAQEHVNPVTDSSQPAGIKRHEKHAKAERKKEWAEMMKTLNLTPEQDAQMKAIRQENKLKKLAIHNDAKLTDAEKHGQLKEIHKTEAASINTILTPEQMEKMKAARQQMKAKRKQHHQGNKTISNLPA